MSLCVVREKFRSNVSEGDFFFDFFLITTMIHALDMGENANYHIRKKLNNAWPIGQKNFAGRVGQKEI